MSSSENAGCNANPAKLGKIEKPKKRNNTSSRVAKLQERIATQECRLDELMRKGKLDGGMNSGPYMGLVEPGKLGHVPRDEWSTIEDILLLRTEIQQCKNRLRQIKDDARVEQTKARESECWRSARKCGREERHSKGDPLCKGRDCDDTSSDGEDAGVDPWGDGSKASEKPNA